MKNGEVSAAVGSDEFKAKLKARWTPERKVATRAKLALTATKRLESQVLVGTRYTPYDPEPKSILIIARAAAIIAKYAAMPERFRLTLRSIFYKLVTGHGMVNDRPHYESLSNIISSARYGGLMAMDAIEDRGRWVRTNDHDGGDPSEWLAAAVGSHQHSRWESQPQMTEIWLEKMALASIIGPTCEALRVPLLPVIGWGSTTAIWDAAVRIKSYLDDGQQVTILHLGDHDPSGVAMTEHFKQKLPLIIEKDGYDPDRLTIKRIGLNCALEGEDQIKKYAPAGQPLPANPVKVKPSGKFADPRAKAYVKAHGHTNSWELDALEPADLIALIRNEVEPMRDMAKWKVSEAEEMADQDFLRSSAEYLKATVAWARSSRSGFA